jgi:hypothetical protein
MLKIKSHAVGIDKGTFTLFSDFETGGKRPAQVRAKLPNGSNLTMPFQARHP